MGGDGDPVVEVVKGGRRRQRERYGGCDGEDGEEDGGRRNFGGGLTVTVRDGEEDGET